MAYASFDESTAPVAKAEAFICLLLVSGWHWSITQEVLSW
jgi:hypothetical protein